MLTGNTWNGRPASRRQRSYRWLFRNGHLRSARQPGVIHSYKLRMYLTVAIFSLFVPMAVVGAVLGGAYFWLTEGLPSVEALATVSDFQTAMIYDRNGTLLYELSDPNGGRRLHVDLADVPQQVIDATLSAEDPRFYDNQGFDIQSITRAFLQNYQGTSGSSGASTITQQLVRNTILIDEKYELSYRRKLREIILSFQVSQRFPKDDVLQMYLNETFYGNNAYGIQAAAWAYFHKDVRELNVAEASLLAGLPQSPTDYNPLINYEQAKIRQGYVIDQMVKRGYLTEEQGAAVFAEKIEFSPQDIEMKAPHFVYYVKDYLERRYGRDLLFTSGWKVYTTLDLNLQDIAQKAASEHVAKMAAVNGHNASVVSMKPSTGEILVMLGSVDFYDKAIDGQVNVANSLRMPGSSIKPFTYVTAFERGFVPGSRLLDTRTYFWQGPAQGPYAPNNHDNTFHGIITMRRALASSMNVAAVMTLNEVGVKDMLATAHRMGITSMEDDRKYGLSVTLGAGDVRLVDITYAYQGFANGGVQVGEPVPLNERRPGMREYDPVVVLKIVDPEGNTFYEYQPPAGKQVISPQAAYFITDIISDDESHAPTYGYNSFLVIDRPAAAKTGTTEYYQDGWTIGYTTDLLTGVWTGNTNADPMKGVFGVSGAGVIWHNFMIPAHQYLNLPPRAFTVPPGMARGTQCGQLDWYVVGREPICYMGPRPAMTIPLRGAPPLPGEVQPPPISPVPQWYKPSLKASNPWLPASAHWAPNSNLPAPIVPGLTAPNVSGAEKPAPVQLAPPPVTRPAVPTTAATPAPAAVTSAPRSSAAGATPVATSTPAGGARAAPAASAAPLATPTPVAPSAAPGGRPGPPTPSPGGSAQGSTAGAGQPSPTVSPVQGAAPPATATPATRTTAVDPTTAPVAPSVTGVPLESRSE